MTPLAPDILDAILFDVATDAPGDELRMRDTDHHAVDRRAGDPQHSDKAFHKQRRIGNQAAFSYDPDHDRLQLPAWQRVEQCALSHAVYEWMRPGAQVKSARY